MKKFSIFGQKFEIITFFIVSLCVLILISLGNWQLQRLREKENFITTIEENIKKANESGNKLTQTLDNNGDLIGVKNIVEVSDVRKMLFENENVVTQQTDHGLSNFKQD